MVDSIIYELANVGLTLLFIVLTLMVMTWLKDKI